MADQEQVGADYRENGFLANTISEVRQHIRTECCEHFQLADDLNRCLMTMLAFAHTNIREATLHTKTLAGSFLHRCITNYQGAVIMLERGMVVEGRTLMRSSLENLLALGALHDKPDDFKQMFEDDYKAARRGQGNYILNKGLSNPESAEFKNLQEVFSNMEKGAHLNMERLSSMSPFAHYYLFYKVLSNDSAHPSATALQRYMVLNEDGSAWTSYVLEPSSSGDIADNIISLLAIGIGAATACSILIEDKTSNDVVGDIAHRFEKLRDCVKSDT